MFAAPSCDTKNGFPPSRERQYHFCHVQRLSFLSCCFMKKLSLLNVAIILFLVLSQVQAATCPDPNNSSLQWGVVPAPWEVNPFSQNRPQGEKNTGFIGATILVAGFGCGVLCTYQNSIGYYSIWWQVGVKIPSRIDTNWRDSLAGFECTGSVDTCVFYPA